MLSRCASQAGFEVTILCWDRSGKRPPVMDGEAWKTVNISAPSTYDQGARQGFGYVHFARRAFQWLRAHEWDIVHCNDLDTLPIGWAASRMTGRQVVFDAHEPYPEMQRERSPILYHVSRPLEWFLARRSSHIITVGEFMRRRFLSLTRNSVEVTVIGNWKDPDRFALPEDVISRARADLKFPPHDLLVGFFGALYRTKPVLPLLEAAKMTGRVAVLIAGQGEDAGLVKEWAERYPWVKFLGMVPSAQVELYTRTCDAMYYGLDPNFEAAIYSTPNTLFSAISAARPVLTTDCGELGEVVRTSGCGYLMPELTTEACRDGLLALLDPAVREKLEEGARFASNQYSVAQAKRRLAAVYSGLSTKREMWQEQGENSVSSGN
ncbi:MAG TPA: glycosyltransferase family 4 protein [Terracidiphilus sp.]|nr:glycosyltransferase family 4 protein [Terracidiphilus sp.]